MFGRWQWSGAVSERRGDNRTKRDTGRDAGRFIGLPVSVMDCPGYAKLSHPARSLLMEVARQCHGDDNGRMLLSCAYLAGRGWKSADVIQRAKKQLIEHNFIFETVKGQRPNKASWYAVTWRRLDKLKGFDPGVEKAFRQGEYRQDMPLPPINVKKLKGYQATNDTPLPPIQNAALIPSDGTAPVSIVPGDGTERVSPIPSDGTMRGVLGGLSITSHGHPLEKPSAGVRVGAGVSGVQAGVASVGVLRERVTKPARIGARTSAKVNNSDAAPTGVA